LETATPPKTKFRIAETQRRQKKEIEQQIADSLRQLDLLQHKGRRRLRQSTVNDMVN
jgi:hypothetical protein